ncbi:MAG: ABC transporter ATP-binding protein [Lachnospira sp.]|nr:ABC transporter ATP-binding protein [Lachnospira sp.]
MSEVAISVKDVSKMYKLFDKNSDRLKDALGFSKKQLYKEHYALHHLSFDVYKGETVGIIGTNGAGKSTILKIITGVLNPTEGELEINGRISALLELGAGFNPEYNGIENVYLNGTMLGFTKEEIDERLPKILEFADIGDFVYQPVKTYSSGMFVRLAFAVAINIDPEILIVDEALSVGDVFFQAKCYQKFEDFKRDGKTILFVSHDLGSISRYCDRVILLNKGEKQSEGKPKDMINLYKRLITTKADNNQNTDSKDKELVSINSISGEWKKNFTVNPKLEEYGDGKANIIDFAIIDNEGNLTNVIEKGTKFTVKTKIRIEEPIKDPIFTLTFKNVRGVDITGTNTMLEDIRLGVCNAGECYIASYEQEMNLQGGEYLISMSCTGYENGDLKAHHRLYDLLSITVVSDKNTVGFYDMNSKVTVERVE